MPEYQVSPKVSGIQDIGRNSEGNSGGGGQRKGGCNSVSINHSQGKAHTVYYQNWKVPSEEDYETVISARMKKVSKSIHTASKKYVSYTKRQLSKL